MGEASQDTITVAAGATGAILGAVAAAATSLGGAWMLWRELRHKIKKESEANSLSHYEGVIARLETEIAHHLSRLDKQELYVAKLSADLEACHAKHAICQEQVDELYRWAARAVESQRRLATLAGRDPGAESIEPPAKRPSSP